MNRLLIIFVVIFYLLPMSSAQGNGYLHVRKASNIYSQPSSKSSVVLRVGGGTILNEVGGGNKTSGYWKVKTSTGVSGYIYQSRGRFTPYAPSLRYAQSECELHILFGLPTVPEKLFLSYRLC